MKSDQHRPQPSSTRADRRQPREEQVPARGKGRGAPQARAALAGGTPDLALLQRITRRAFVHMNAMIHAANHRDDIAEGDPKVGGHPAACASSMDILAALHLVVREPQDYVCCKPHASPADHALHHALGLFRHPDGRWFDEAESERAMLRLRDFSRDGEPVFQSYHAEADPDSFHFLPSGSVGIPPVASVYLALAYRYARNHGWELPPAHFWSLMGDSEFREGSLMEVLPEVAEREIGNVTWIVDYNRQNLDGTRIPNKRALQGTDAQRIQKTCEANGWKVRQLMHGRRRLAAFQQPGGNVLQDVLENGFTDYHLQSLLWKRDPALVRETLLQIDRKVERVVGAMSDDALWHVFVDLGGHDLDVLVEALRESRSDPETPWLLVAHTIKGAGLECFAATGNHSAMVEDEEMHRLLEGEGLTAERPFARFRAGSPEAEYLERRGAAFRAGIEEHDAMRARHLRRVRESIAADGGIPDTLEINLKLAPVAHTQWMWGQLAAKLVRIGVHDELAQAGKGDSEAATAKAGALGDAGEGAGRDDGQSNPKQAASSGRRAGRLQKELTEFEKRWNTVADLVLTMAPDVGTSTNINPAMDEKIYGPESEQNWEKELELRERLRPELAPTDEAWTRHIRFEIAEANCMTALGSFGKMGQLTGIPFLPMMTIYDFFIKRALDQLFYDLYWGAGFILVGTPSGVTLAPEGAQHSWKSDIQIPNLITWEPAFAIELDWILCDAMQRHFEGRNQGRSGVLIRGVTRGIRQDLLLKNLRRQARFKQDLPEGALLGASGGDGGLPETEVPALPDAEILAALREDVLAGAYFLVDWRGYRGYAPGENVVHLFVQGALVREAVEASHKLAARGIYANVIVVSSSELLLGKLGHEDDYRHLGERLGVDGALHLAPAGRPGAGTGAGGRDQAPGLSELDAIDLAGRRVPVVSVHDGEEGLLDNIGSIAGTRQIALCVRKFSKSGTPRDIYRYHHLDPDSIADACGRALAEAALEDVRLSPAGFARLQQQARRSLQHGAKVDWRELWPEQV